MKKIYVGIWLSVIAIFVVSGCRKEARYVPGADITSKAQTDSTGCIYKDSLKLNNKSGSRVLVYKQLVNRAVDATGRVEIAVWRSINEGQHVSAQVSVDPGYVLVGGGADITNTSENHTGVNALLTAAYPVNDGTFSTFAAESKDHVHSYYHHLYVYAIGMRLLDASGNPLSDSYVRSFMSLNQVTSASAQRPEAIVYSPSGNKVLGGGAKINWSGAGNLLVRSRPVNEGWAANGKDHVHASPATIDAYAISINPDIPGFGRLAVALKGTTISESTHTLEATSFAPDGWLISGVGAHSFYNGQGRLLYSMYPISATQAFAASKDHVSDDYGFLDLIWVILRKE